MKLMKKLLIVLALLPLLSQASEGGFPLDHAPDRSRQLSALQNGAKLFVNYCLNCHAASLVRYNRLRDIGLSEQQIRENLLFTSDKVGDLMKTAMTEKDAKAWFGAVPPDLSVLVRAVARVHEIGGVPVLDRDRLVRQTEVVLGVVDVVAVVEVVVAGETDVVAEIVGEAAREAADEVELELGFGAIAEIDVAGPGAEIEAGLRRPVEARLQGRIACRLRDAAEVVIGGEGDRGGHLGLGGGRRSSESEYGNDGGSLHI